MKKFTIIADVVARGTQVWHVEAESAEDARRIFDDGGGDFEAEEIEVTDYSDVEVSEDAPDAPKEGG